MIEDTVYMVLNRRGVIRTGKRQPAVVRGEVLVAVKIRYNDDLFENHIPTAVVNIRPDNVIVTDPPVRTGDLVDATALRVRPVSPPYDDTELRSFMSEYLTADGDEETRQR